MLYPLLSLLPFYYRTSISGDLDIERNTMKKLTILLVGVVSVVLVNSLRAQDGTNLVYTFTKEVSKTNKLVIVSISAPAKIDVGMHDPNKDFWPAVSDMISKKGNQTAGDKIGYFRNLSLVRERTRLGRGFLDRQASYGQRIFENTIGDSARDIFVEMVPIDDIAKEHESRFLDFFGNLFRGSVGNTEEERREMGTSTPQSASLDKDSWLRKDGNGLLGYGVRPYRESPYIYGTFGIGHINGQPFLIDARLYSMIMDTAVGNPKVELSTTIVCSRLSHIVIGGNMYPASLGSREHQPSGSIRYERILFDRVRTKFWSVGVESSGSESLASLMFTSSW